LGRGSKATEGGLAAGAGLKSSATAREALAKAAEFFEEGHRQVIFKDLLGNVLDRAVVMTMAEIED
jgi:hypothetical protein